MLQDGSTWVAWSWPGQTPGTGGRESEDGSEHGTGTGANSPGRSLERETHSKDEESHVVDVASRSSAVSIRGHVLLKPYKLKKNKPISTEGEKYGWSKVPKLNK